MHFRILLLILLTAILEVSAQKGRFLLVGGGSEKIGASGWSTPAYKWAVQGKRVAVIGTSTGSLAPYLTQYCGASFAREMAIASRDSADSQITYDTLVSYDAIFFRGGDQWEYYNSYRNTKLQEAVEYIYSHGGTICGTSAGMHILSSTVFTAEEGTVYSYECIENPNNLYVTLESDFFNFMPGYLFDTHFAERSRFGRLSGFLANLKLNKGMSVTGLGMDDLTCMTVDTNGIGTVYGTGCANIYNLIGEVSLHGTKLLADSVRVIQLLQGCTYDFNTSASTFESLDRDINTDQLSESGNHNILASGGYKLNENLSMLTDFTLTTGNPLDPILILSGDNTLAESFRSKLTELGATVNGIINPSVSNGSDTAVKGLIIRSGKFLFLENDAASFTEFLSTLNGLSLLQKIRAEGSITAFAGNDARFAGKTVVDNYLEYLNSYYAEMTFSKGLGLLQNTVILPNTYMNSDIYENTSTAIPYAMSLDTLKYGIWLTNHNYMKYAPVEGKAILTGYGIDPVMIIRNSGHRTGFSTHTATGSASISPRQIAGMEQLVLSLIDETKPYVFGSIQSNGNIEHKAGYQSFECNRSADILNIFTESPIGSWEIIGSNGTIMKKGQLTGLSTQVDMHFAKKGLYIVRINTGNHTQHAARKIIW